MSRLKTLVIAPSATHKATVIFLHGLGDTGHGWAPVANMMKPFLPHVKFILPHAPHKPVTLNFGMSMPAWYDIYSLDDRDSREDQAGMMETVAQGVDELIQAEVSLGIPSNKIVLGGFSQGAAMTLLYSLTSQLQLGGILSLSGYLPLRTRIDSLIQPINTKTPLLMCHGDADEVVAHEWGLKSFDFLKKVGKENLEFKTYPRMGHSSSEEEIRDLVQFLTRVLPSKE